LDAVGRQLSTHGKTENPKESKYVTSTLMSGYTYNVAQEAALPHSARSIVFLSKDIACFAYSPTEFALFSIQTMTTSEIVFPLPTTASGSAMNAFSGLTGYMTLGLGAKAKPAVVQVTESEVLIARDGNHRVVIVFGIISQLDRTRFFRQR